MFLKFISFHLNPSANTIQSSYYCIIGILRIKGQGFEQSQIRSTLISFATKIHEISFPSQTNRDSPQMLHAKRLNHIDENYNHHMAMDIYISLTNLFRSRASYKHGSINSGNHSFNIMIILNTNIRL